MINVLELNVANYDDHHAWEARLPLIVNAIVAANADIAGLSEIRYNPNNFFNTICGQFWAQPQYSGVNAPNCAAMDMGAQILAMLQIQTGYENATIFTSPAATYPGGIWEGLSIVSRLPVLNSGYLPLTSSGGDANARGTQWAQIQSLGGNTLYVYNTHFALDEQDRLTNAQQTLNLIGGNINGLCCLVGDLNGTPDDAAVQSLASAGLVDVWLAANSGQNGYSFPSTGPTKRIDYCWASPSMAAAVNGASLVANTPSSGVLFASDHIGLLTSFNIS